MEAVAQYVKANYTSNYDQSVMADIEKKAEQTGSGKSGGSSSAVAEPEPNSAELDGDEVSICYVANYVDPCPIWDPAESAGTENQVLLQIYETLLKDNEHEVRSVALLKLKEVEKEQGT